MESVSQQPLFREDKRGAQIFALVFVWVIVFVCAWHILYVFSGLFFDYCFLFVVGAGITFIVVVMQVHVAEKVYPLIYVTPLVDALMIQALAGLGFSNLSGVLSLIIFLVAVNCVILALAWDEMANRSTSGISGMWLCIMPVACLLMMSSSAILRFGLEWWVNDKLDSQWIAWPAIWLATAIGLVVLFVLAERRQALPREKWILPPLLLIWCVLTFAIGLLVMGLTDFSMVSILALITPAIAQFGVASAELEALMRVRSGRVAAAIAFTGGYVLALICSFLTWTLFFFSF